jgi:hypothetical protein
MAFFERMYSEKGIGVIDQNVLDIASKIRSSKIFKMHGGIKRGTFTHCVRSVECSMPPPKGKYSLIICFRCDILKP